VEAGAQQHREETKLQHSRLAQGKFHRRADGVNAGPGGRHGGTARTWRCPAAQGEGSRHDRSSVDDIRPIVHTGRRAATQAAGFSRGVWCGGGQNPRA
jgi:hypothetical protein